jgi:hypothetical protein
MPYETPSIKFITVPCWIPDPKGVNFVSHFTLAILADEVSQ